MKPVFPSLADEIAEPRPDMNIKVAAFTVSEKSINTCVAACGGQIQGLPYFWFSVYISEVRIARLYCI